MFARTLANVNRFSEGSFLWVLSLAAIVVVQLFVYREAISGDWFRSGNDMEFLIPAVKNSIETGHPDWLWGPWVGEIMFSYYRPVTSLFFTAEYVLFGEKVLYWQITSLIVHVASTVIFACLVAGWFGNRVAGWVAATVWGVLRFRNDLTIEWTPAQTDLLAGFFTLAALVLVLAYSQRGSRVALVGGILALILAMGSKEVALVSPVLAIILIWALPEIIPARRKVVTFVVLGGLVCFLALRSVALEGSGFLPGQETSLSMSSVAKRLANHLLPTAFGPNSVFSPLGGFLLGVGVMSAWFFRKNKVLAFSSFGLLFAGALLLVGQEFIVLWSFWRWAFECVIAFGLLVFCWHHAKRFLVWTFVWGVVVWAPLYHVVYNKAGNVSYLADTYWGLIWACVVYAVVRFMDGKFVATTPEPIRGSRGGNHSLDEPTQVLQLQSNLNFH
jgi:hypothetical protein